MQIIELPLTGQTRAAAAATTLACAALVAWLPIHWPWRLAVIGLTLMTGLSAWRRYVRTRPQRLWIRTERDVHCGLTDGSYQAIERILPGVINPTLVSAVLLTPDGVRRSLVVPAHSIDRQGHWRLRRTLLAWRSRADSADERQSLDRSGT